MGDLFTQVFTPAPYYPRPQFFYDAAPAPSTPPEAPAAPPEAPARGRIRKQSRRAEESSAAAPKPLRASAPRKATHAWCYGAFEGVSEVLIDGTRVQGWLKVPIEEGDDLIEEGDDLDDENDEAMAPVKEWNYTEFDRYVRTYNPQMNVPEAQQLVPGSIAIDVGDYYVAIDGQVLRAIGTLMMATDDLRGPLHDMFCCRPCCSQEKLMRLVEHSARSAGRAGCPSSTCIRFLPR